MLKDVLSSAAALFDGGWRSGDMEELMIEYGLTEDDARAICRQLAEFEEKNGRSQTGKLQD